MDHDVFISYSSKNRTTASAICHVLEQHRIKCWMAPRDIPAGADYGDVIDEAIESCKVFLIVFSQPASLSQWVRGELNLAFSEGKYIIPYRIDETPLKGAMRVILNQTHWIEAYPDAEAKFGELAEAIVRFSGSSPGKSGEKEGVSSGNAPSGAETAHPYKAGDYYRVNGREGIVFKVDESGMHGKIVAMRDLPIKLAWGLAYETGAGDMQEGVGNMKAIRQCPG